MATKTGRNERCPCGSGKKYKHCHGWIAPEPSGQTLPPGLAKVVAEASAKAMAKEAQRVAQQGLGRPIISAEFGGGRVVAVRKKLYHVKGKTFHDFLGNYLKDVLDPAWGNAELKKPLSDRHPVLQWYDSICNLQQRSGVTTDPVVQVEANGASSAWLRLAYDLYALDHNAELQKKLVGRLKNPDMFPGARYETYVAAAMIRAGFDIVFEDENDRSATHCEFVASCKASGNMYSVEAKHRNRSDATGTLKFRLGRRLQGALRKRAAHPRIVFLDVGALDDQRDDTLPGFMRQALHDLRRFEGRALNGHPLPAAYVFLTNMPSDRDLEGAVRRTVILAEGFQIPNFKLDAGFPTLREAYAAMQAHQDIHDLARSLRDHSEVPATFDGEAPELAFSINEARLRVGSWYEVQVGPEGETAPAKLLQGIVSEPEQSATCIFQLQERQQVIVRVPLSAAELQAYRRHPATFFERIEPSAGQTIETPFKMFMWFLEAHKNATRAQLLANMAGSPNLDVLERLTDRDLLEEYAERMTWTIWAQTSKNKSETP